MSKIDPNEAVVVMLQGIQGLLVGINDVVQKISFPGYKESFPEWKAATGSVVGTVQEAAQRVTMLLADVDDDSGDTADITNEPEPAPPGLGPVDDEGDVFDIDDYK